MTLTDKRLRKRCRKIVKAAGLERELDDFMGYVQLARCEERRANLHALWTDYVRKEYGDTRYAYMQGLHTDHPRTLKAAEKVVAPTHAGADLSYALRFFTDTGTFEGQRERAMLTLRYEWSFTLEEIGHAFGLERSTVCEILKNCEHKLRVIIQSKIGEDL